jgi:Protein of unknown function (DUF664)
MSGMSDQPQRWTEATVYPDMWVDPDQDPRNSGGVSPDGELATLSHYLDDYRLTLRMKCEGLSPEQLARRSVPPSTMSLLGLLRDLAEAERDWRGWVLPGQPPPKLDGARDAAFDERWPLRQRSTPLTPTWPGSRQPPTPYRPNVGTWESDSARTASPSQRCSSTGLRSTPDTRPRRPVEGVHRRPRRTVRPRTADTKIRGPQRSHRWPLRPGGPCAESDRLVLVRAIRRRRQIVAQNVAVGYPRNPDGSRPLPPGSRDILRPLGSVEVAPPESAERRIRVRHEPWVSNHNLAPKTPFFAASDRHPFAVTKRGLKTGRR